jgi:hypothetical protein
MTQGFCSTQLSIFSEIPAAGCRGAAWSMLHIPGGATRRRRMHGLQQVQPCDNAEVLVQAVVGAAAVEYLNSVDAVARGLAAQFKVPVGEVPARVAGELLAVF